MKTPFRSFSLCVTMGVLVAGAALNAAVVQQEANDPFANTSFNTGTRWSNGEAPSANNDYESNKVLRTPAGGIDYTFQGKSLTMRWGGTLAFKGTAATTITINDLRLRAGSKISNQELGRDFTLAGTISINADDIGNFVIDGNNGGILVDSLISGAGSVQVTREGTGGQTNSQVVLANSGNSYSGGTSIGANAWLVASNGGALGSGDVLLNGGRLSFQSTTGTDFIASGARLIVSSGLQDSLVELSYTGVNTIAGLSIDGGLSFLASGLYDAQALNQLYGTDLFSGSGQFNVVIPESSSLSLSAAVCALLAIVIHRRFRA